MLNVVSSFKLHVVGLSSVLKFKKMSQKRKQISLEQKLDILKRFKSGEKSVDIGRNLGLAPSTIKSICSRDAEKIKKFAESATSLQHKRVTKIRGPLLEKTESLLMIWIKHQNQRRVPLSQMVIQNKARSIFEDLKENYPLSSAESAEEFEASRGWFDRFRTRANLHNILLKGEAASADNSAAEKFKLELKAIIEEGGYSPQQVLNADETGLFWKRLPERTYISKSEKSAPGHKCSKDRLTLLLGGNAAGDFKFKPFLIYHSENPRALKNVEKSQLPVHWRANKKAWMTATLFRDWMENCAAPEIKAYCSSKNIEFKVILLLDNAPGHPIFSDDYSENIKVVFMPPNTTSVLQPMDQGVISNFKLYYLRRTFSQLLKATDGDNLPSMNEFWKSYNILMAIENINLSWKEVKESCMNGTWRQLWPECVLKDTEDISDIPLICKELADTAKNNNFYGMEEQDINEHLLYDEELNNETLIEVQSKYALDDEELPLEVEAEEKKLTATKISEAMQLIAQAMDIFESNDPDEDRSSKVSRSVNNAINCYKELYMKKKSVTIQKTLDNFIKNSATLTNPSTKVNLVDSSSEYVKN